MLLLGNKILLFRGRNQFFIKFLRSAANSTMPTMSPTAAVSPLVSSPSPPHHYHQEQDSIDDDGSGLSTTVREGNILCISIDSPVSSVNIMSAKMLSALPRILSKLNDPSLKYRGAVIISKKEGSFFHGADINMFTACKSSAEFCQLAQDGQRIFDLLEKIRVPIVAAINGQCLGGGLELALACTYRIATTSDSTRLGLPEVKLGILPAAGGTQRLPRLVGIRQALSMMTAGSLLDAKRAFKVGLVDEVVDPFALEQTALTVASELASGKLKVSTGRRGRSAGSLMEILLERNSLGRYFLFGQAKASVLKASKGQYPAPLSIIKAVETGINSGMAAGLLFEATEFGRLGMTPISKALRGLFFASTSARKNPFVNSSSSFADSNINSASKQEEDFNIIEGRHLPEQRKAAAAALAATQVQSQQKQKQLPTKAISVIGSGLMGSGIAHVAAGTAKLAVALKDKTKEAVLRGEAAAVTGLLKRKSQPGFESIRHASLITALCDEDAAWPKRLALSDVVIEAIYEDLEMKRNLIRQVEPLMRPDAIFATNTSALSVTEIAEASSRPEQVIGLHFFSPVDRMPLVELIEHAKTSRATAWRAFELASRMGKTVIVVKDVPGFFVNRCLGPFMAEALILLRQGVDPHAIDNALIKFGMPMGPIALLDEVGIDIALKTCESLAVSPGVGSRLAGMGGANYLPSLRKVSELCRGKKDGAGFYLHRSINPEKSSSSSSAASTSKLLIVNSMAMDLLFHGSKIKQPVQPMVLLESDIVDRMIMRFVSEAIWALDDHVIRSVEDGDLASVFGIGWPPFLGGPFRYIDEMGAKVAVKKFVALANAHGQHFAPPKLLVSMAADGRTFY
jgi:3-hydroxyacyl-CoA dehydrogenase/enoyl-CoA hydratase/carnithine racemase